MKSYFYSHFCNKLMRMKKAMVPRTDAHQGVQWHSASVERRCGAVHAAVDAVGVSEGTKRGVDEVAAAAAGSIAGAADDAAFSAEALRN